MDVLIMVSYLAVFANQPVKLLVLPIEVFARVLDS